MMFKFKTSSQKIMSKAKLKGSYREVVENSKDSVSRIPKRITKIIWLTSYKSNAN